MKQSKLFRLLFPLLIMSIPWIYLAFIWKGLPQTIPTHFGIDETADKFGNKDEIVLAPIIMTVVGLRFCVTVTAAVTVSVSLWLPSREHTRSAVQLFPFHT